MKEGYGDGNCLAPAATAAEWGRCYYTVMPMTDVLLTIVMLSYGSL